MEADIGCGLQMKSQQELFVKRENFITRRSKEEKKVRFKSATVSSPQKSKHVSEELYFDALNQNVITNSTTAVLVSKKSQDESIDLYDLTEEANKKKWKRKKAMMCADVEIDLDLD
ncbi:hypothetical protein C1646_755241 [Rhizophagus diaphanus]|nr:hypothetical protein C1646_755241 [Rhizophagus diaphanus] [Rhizophagus sp. MUCL 43196]